MTMNPGESRSTEEAQALLEATQASEHSRCLFCGKENPIGFKLEFCVQDRDSVRASFSCDGLFQSYPTVLHGGMTSALLDAAMTNCLFSRGVVAVTGELVVRYLVPVEVDCEAELWATIKKVARPLYCLSAELRQHGRVVARATAKFVERGRRSLRSTVANQDGQRSHSS